MTPSNPPLISLQRLRAQLAGGDKSDWRNGLVLLAAGLVGLVLGTLCVMSPLLGLIAVLGTAFCLLALEKPVVLGYTLIAVITLTGGMQRGRLIPILTPNEIFLVLAVAMVLPIFLLSKQRRGDSKAVLGAFVILVIGTVLVPTIDFLMRGVTLDIDNAFKLMGPVQYFLLFWIFTLIATSEADSRRLVLWMLICGAIVGVVGLLQAARVGPVISVLNNWFSSIHLGASLESEAGRITSLLGAWNALGMFMMTCVILAWAILPAVNGRYEWIIVVSSMLLCGLCLIASGSFAGNLGMAAGVALLVLMTRRVQKMLPVLILIVLAITLFFLLAQSFLRPLVEERIAFQYEGGDSLVPQTLAYRFDVWRDVFMPPIRAHFPRPVYPIVPPDYAWLYEESQYVMLLFRTGLAGFVGHLLWFAIIVFWLSRRVQQDNERRQAENAFTRALAPGVLTLVLVLSVAGFTNAVFNYSGSIDYMWIMFALVASSSEEVTVKK